MRLCCWGTCLHGTGYGHAVGIPVCMEHGVVMLLGNQFAQDRVRLCCWGTCLHGTGRDHTIQVPVCI